MIAEYVVFVTPTVLQLSMFYKILNPDKLNDLIQSSTAESLALINILTKISNSPILLKATADKAKNRKNGAVDPAQCCAADDALELLPTKAHVADMSLSGKSICCGLNDIQRSFINLSSRKTVMPSYNAQNHTTGNIKFIKISCRALINVQNTSEKCVLVSHYTSTLNILEAYCRKSSYSHYRLDG